MEEIYNEIDEYNKSMEVNNYIKYNIKPTYPKRTYNIPPPLKPSNILKTNNNKLNTNNNELRYYIDDINKILNKINILQNELKNVVNNDNNCPICFEPLNNYSYIITKCKHKTCLKCYIECLNQNKNYSNKCSICRSDII